jgi:hypothetical protein
VGISIQCSDLIEDVRLRADLPTFTTTTSVRTADILYWLKRSLQRLSGIVMHGATSTNFVNETTLTTTADVDMISLPTNAQALVSVYYVRDGETEIPMDPMGPDDLGDVSSRDWDGATPRYTIKGESIQLRPVPAGEYTVRVEYVTGLIITASTDYVPLYSGWDEWVVLDAAIKVKQRLQQPYAELAQERATVEAEIRSQAKRNRFRGAVVRDLRPRHEMGRRPYRRWPGE